jgi:hypothetical protein
MADHSTVVLQARGENYWKPHSVDSHTLFGHGLEPESFSTFHAKTEYSQKIEESSFLPPLAQGTTVMPTFLCFFKLHTCFVIHNLFRIYHTNLWKKDYSPEDE